MFKLPYSLVPVKNLKGGSERYLGIAGHLQNFFPFLKVYLKQAELAFSAKEYLAMCIFSNIIFYMFMVFILSLVLLSAGQSILFALILPMILAGFAFAQQLYYPKMIANKRVREIERNLLPALQNMMVQLNSGVPLFDTLVNISNEDYGAISKEFSHVVREINAGRSQIDALEEIATLNPSTFFRRAVWQIVNGMKSGADMSRVIEESISILSEEQILQIQRYGSQLNPLAMFYMLIVVIGPSLGMTFLIILSSFLNLPSMVVKTIFWVVYGGVVFVQIMFIGMIKSKRPNLLGD